MRLLASAAILVGLVGGLSGIRFAGDSCGATEPKREASGVALTTEQVGVYREVLRDYVGKSDGVLNLADTTYILDLAGSFGIDSRCLQGIKLEPSGSSTATVHDLSPAVTLSPKMKLVNPDEQEKKIEMNDPQILVKSAIDEHAEVTDKQVEDSVKRAFETGLFSFSEIRFDKQHRIAVVQYGFACGRLCGHGRTLVLKKSGDKWKIKRRCGGWVS
jgi:hypothetical protein